MARASAWLQPVSFFEKNRLPGALYLGSMFYRRNLQHWVRENTSVFVTWRVWGTWRGLPSLGDGRSLAEADREWDSINEAEALLRNPAVAEAVAATIEEAAFSRRMFELHAFVVMPNHVHLLITPGAEIPEITRWIKGVSARRANAILNRAGQRFWQDECFDHWVRHPWEGESIARYIERNPVRAGLVREAALWPYSSAARIKNDTG